MALYSNFLYANHLEKVGIQRPDDLSKDIGSLCFRAYLSILPVHPKGGGPGGANVVTSYAGMEPGYAGSLRYDGAPWFDWGRP